MFQASQLPSDEEKMDFWLFRAFRERVYVALDIVWWMMEFVCRVHYKVGKLHQPVMPSARRTHRKIKSRKRQTKKKKVRREVGWWAGLSFPPHQAHTWSMMGGWEEEYFTVSREATWSFISLSLPLSLFPCRFFYCIFPPFCVFEPPLHTVEPLTI